MLAHHRLVQRGDADDREAPLAGALLPRDQLRRGLVRGQRADDEEPVLLRLADQEREQLARRRVGPLQVLDDDDQRRAASLAGAEEAVHVLHRLHDAVVEAVLLPGRWRRRLLPVRRRDERAQQTANLRGNVGVGVHRRHHLLEDLEERRVDALAIDRAAAAEDARAVELRAQRGVAHDAALPQPLGAGDDHAAAAALPRVADQRRELSDLVLSSDQRRGEELAAAD